MKKLWKKYNQLSTKCYEEMIQSSRDTNVWNEAFEALLEAVRAERTLNPDFGSELLELEEGIDYQCDVIGWLEDYLDELDIREDYERLRQTCETVIGLFRWEEDSPSDFRFLIAASYRHQGRMEEAHTYCEKWYQAEPDNIYAATAIVYAKIGVKDFAGAGKAVEKFIPNGTVCSDDNEMMFAAASILYKTNGDKESEERVVKELEKYDKELREFFFGSEYGGEELDFALNVSRNMEN